MMTLFFVAPLTLADTIQPPAALAIEITGLLDLAGVAIAIWTFWSSIGLHLGGQFQHAFRLISVGAMAFALSHLLDSILQLLNLNSALLIHQGAVLTSMLLFVPGLASLADALPHPSSQKEQPSLQLLPLAVGLVILVGTFSFILYGLSPLAETWAFFGLDGGLILLSGVCLSLVVRARLGGAIGRSLWQAMLGLLLFSLAHPLQVWFYEETVLDPALLGIIHRLVVIPAFFLFAFSITNVARSLNVSIAGR